MKKIIKLTNLWAVLLITSLFMTNCEQDSLEAGYDLLANPANSNKHWINLVSYNMSNNDSVRADYQTLGEGVFGVYYENIFGRSRADYVTQVRLSTNDPSFSDSLKSVDSAAFYFTPRYGDTISTQKIYVDANGDRYDRNLTDNVDTFRLVKKYELLKYGDGASQITMNVGTVNKYLYATDKVYYSDNSLYNIGVEQHLGSGVIKDVVVGTYYQDSNGTKVTKINGNTVTDIPPSVRISLDENYFQTNLLDKQGNVDLQDDARFTRFMKGIKLSTSTSEVNGFMVNFKHSDLQMTVYYKYTKKKTKITVNNITKDTIYQGTSTFNYALGSSTNVKVGLYEHTRNGSYQSHTSTNNITGNDLLYLQGIGGPKIVVKLNAAELAAVKDSINIKGWSIVDAKLRFHEATVGYSLQNPTAISGYLYNAIDIPFTLSDVDQKKFMTFPEFFTLGARIPTVSNEFLNNSGSYTNNLYYNTETDQKYYDFKLTTTLKNIVEKDSINRPIVIEMGNYIYNTATQDGVQYSKVPTNYLPSLEANRSQMPFTPHRLVFYGNTYADVSKSLRLEITYIKTK